ncbi:hypothetical protein NIES3275_29240 [Microchaete diplosiphon NIES-3275]|nr:hypothetical protein NIES3275_29240 [Microchaete diplosiphon NIES-3275]
MLRWAKKAEGEKKGLSKLYCIVLSFLVNIVLFIIYNGSLYKLKVKVYYQFLPGVLYFPSWAKRISIRRRLGLSLLSGGAKP